MSASDYGPDYGRQPGTERVRGGEEACDVCEEKMERQRETDHSGRRSDHSNQGEADEAQDRDFREQFTQQQREREWQARQLQIAEQQDAVAVRELERQIERWASRCAWCLVRGRDESREHRFRECTLDGSNTVRVQIRERGMANGFNQVDTDNDQFMGWIGQKIESGQVEGTRFIMFFFKLAQSVTGDVPEEKEHNIG